VIKSRLVPGERIPKFYAVAYRDWERDFTVIYPIGIHWLVRWWRDLLFWSRFSFKNKRHRMEEELFMRGYLLAFNRLNPRLIDQERELAKRPSEVSEAYSRGWQAAFDDMDASLKKRFSR